jgi:hypothetical protein
MPGLTPLLDGEDRLRIETQPRRFNHVNIPGAPSVRHDDP